MAYGYRTLTAAADPATVKTALEAEANISEVAALGTIGEDTTDDRIASGEVLAAPAKVVFRITGTAILDITNAVTAVGGLEAASGYPADTTDAWV